MPRHRCVAPLLAAVLAAVPALSAGCSGEGAPPNAGPRALAAPPGPGGGAGRAPGIGLADDLEGDQVLVARAVATTTELQRAVAAARRRHPGLDDRLAPLSRAHAAQRRALLGALPEGASDGQEGSGRALPPTRQPERALELLRRREQRAGKRLRRLAVRAESGRFARVLASMTASTAQARVALGAGVRDRPGGPGTAGADAPGDGGDPAEGTVPALQDALAAEHAALWLLGVLGARTSATGSPATFFTIEAAYDAHRARRDGLTDQLRALGEDPVAASPTYELPRAVTSARVVRRLGRRLEGATAGWWAALASTSVGPLRRDAAVALGDAAQRQVAFGGAPQAFPGAPEMDSG